MKKYYQVAKSGGDHARYWTVVYGAGDAETEIDTSWATREMAADICDLMNMAFEHANDLSPQNKGSNLNKAELRAQGLSQEDREALLQAADFIEPRLMSSTLATSRGHEIAAILRRLGGQTT